VVSAVKVLGPHRANYFQQLHALDVSTGAEKLGGPVTIQATVPGRGDGGAVVRFNPRSQLGRAGLLLEHGVVYTAWTSFCDHTPVHGWVLGYRADTLRRVRVFNTSPDGMLATVWQSGGGLAADAAGNIYFITGNGTFDQDTGGRDDGDTVLKLGPSGRVRDFFTPFNQARLAANDLDLGSGGLLLLPEEPGISLHLMVGAGKEGTLYLLDRNHLGRFHAHADRVVQTLRNVIGPSFGSPAYFNTGAPGRSWVYYAGVGDFLKAFQFVNGVLSPAPSSQSSTAFAYPGGTPSVSANGTTNGLVWVLSASAPALHAYDATNLGQELYNSNQAGARDRLDSVVKFTVPVVADGKVFVGTAGTLTVFGELG
jgi:hypothetical protein